METMDRMPARRGMRKITAGAAAIALAGSLGAIAGFDNAGAAPGDNVKYSLNLTGADTGVPETGQAIVQVKGKKLRVCVLIKKVGPNLTPKTGLAPGKVAIAAHIHAGASNVQGPIVVPLNTPVLKGKKYQKSKTCVDGVDAGLVADLKANPSQYYVNVHTNDFPGGAIRGQLAP